MPTMKTVRKDPGSVDDPTTNLYQPADFVVVRAPLLPVEFYHRLPPTLGAVRDHDQWLARLVDDGPEGADVRRALAVGSVTFLDALQSASRRGGHRSPKAARSVAGALVRYMIRMSTRPTPFGLFAGVALGQWGERTDLELARGRRSQRTRPDMAWLMRLVDQLESVAEIRQHVRLVANHAALIRGGRVQLAERVSRGDAPVPPAVSIRATGVVRRALAAARVPIPFDELAGLLLENTPGATVERIETLLTELWEHTLLLTELRPPLTVENPARYVIDRLEGIPAAAEVRAQIQSVVDAAAEWDAAPVSSGTERYRTLVARATAVAPSDRSPLQVDATLALAGRTVSHRVGTEAARAAELLLRLSPLPRGPAHLAAYRRSFEHRYGAHREVALLELLDPNCGLGPPTSSGWPSPADAGIGPAKAAQRNQALLDVAVRALRDRQRCAVLDDETLRRIQTWEPSASEAPPSLDLYVSVAAGSPGAIDAGDFELVVGPNVGGMAAGRTLGRFADLLPDANDVLARVATREEEREPDALWVELAYQPRSHRLGNVSIRPNVRDHEIALGVSAGREPARTIPVDELVVGVRHGRFYVHWPQAGRDLVVTAGHMLTSVRAPALARFLSDVGRDGHCQLAGFHWGAASTFPYLPRLRVGRVVLSLAQWRLSSGSLGDEPGGRPGRFAHGLERWRDEWDVPRHVYLSAGDNRLLLDLDAELQVEELRRALGRRPGDSIVVTEVFPDLDQAWLLDTDGRPFVTELVVPLVLHRDVGPVAPDRLGDEHRPSPRRALVRRTAGVVPATVSLRPPGSEWAFAKLYCGHDFEDDLLAGPVRDFTDRVLAKRLADRWFFIRYSDPDRHVRLRFHGRPDTLLRDLVPMLCAWVEGLIEDGTCRRLVLDTYDREVERFGGDEAMAAAETLFGVDSDAVVDLLELAQTRLVSLSRLPLAVLTVDALLDGLGLDVDARVGWCGRQAPVGQVAGADYRRWKAVLRPLLGDRHRVRSEPGGLALDDVLGRIRAGGVAFRHVTDELEAGGALTRSPSEVRLSIVHLHLNRLLGADPPLESRVFGLLGRVHQGLLRRGIE